MAGEGARERAADAAAAPRPSRQDLLKQLFRWAEADAGDSLETYGVVTGVEVIDVSDVLSVGFTITVHEQLPSGRAATRDPRPA